MSKKAVTMLLAMLFMLALLTPVCADDTEIVGLGTFTAGSSVDIFINKTSGGAVELASGELPQGLELVSEEREDGTSFYLRGTPLSAGSFSFVLRYLDGAGVLLTEASYSLNVEAAHPALSYERNFTVTAGKALTISVNASVSDAGSLSCRWYFGTGGENMAILPDQTFFSITADTSKEGEFCYRCEVTNTNNSVQASTLSEMIWVTVKSPELTAISINSMPAKQEYEKGESVSTDGLKLLLTFSDGSTKTVSDGFTISPNVLDSVGTRNITVSYKGFSCFYPVLVSESEETIKEIKVISRPDKTEYAPGETISLEGLKIRVITNKETRDIITGFFCTPTTFYEAGKQTVTVFYGESECTFDILVKSTAATPSPTPIPTPVPVVTPQPVTPTPIPTPVPNLPAETGNEEPAPDEPEEIKIPEGAVPDAKDKEKETEKPPRLTVAILVIAIVALACLGVYVYVMQNPKARKAVRNLVSDLLSKIKK